MANMTHNGEREREKEPNKFGEGGGTFIRDPRASAKTLHCTPANWLNTDTTSLGSNFHFASVPFRLVDTVSALSSSFNRLNSFSSPLTANTPRVSSPCPSTSSSPPPPRPLIIPDHDADKPLRGDCAGPPGCRIAPTAVDREILFGRTRNEVAPGMMRSP